MKDQAYSYEMPRLRMAAAIVAAVFILAGISLGFSPLSFNEINGQKLLELLGGIILISLFVERGLEFFVELWRGATKNFKVHQVDRLKQEIKRLETQGVETKMLAEKYQTLDKLCEDVHRYTNITARVALWTSFLFGLLISVVGVRALAPLVKVPNVWMEAGMTGSVQLQAYVFRAADIILTACLIAGGSEGLHKIMRLYNRFMDESARRVKEGSPGTSGG